MPAFAGAPIVIDLPAANGSNCFPFGCDTLLYQQVYAPRDFAGVTKLTSITSDNTTCNSGRTNDPTVVTLHRSTTSTTVNGLSTTFADRPGADNPLVYTGTVATPAFDGDFTRSFSKAFTYQPSAGSLRPDVTTTANNHGVGGVRRCQRRRH